MRAVMVMFDSLIRDYLPGNSDKSLNLPHFEKLTKNSTVFENFYSGSLPCIPARRELHTGKYNFLHRTWGPLEPFDNSVISELSKNEIYTHLITDHFHYWEDGGSTYHSRYDSWEGFRGQENDAWKPMIHESKKDNNNKFNRDDKDVLQHYANRDAWKSIEDTPTFKVIESGKEFIKKYKDDENWFLQLECFSPHEPFYIPGIQDIDSSIYWPKYGEIDLNLNRDEINDSRDLYSKILKSCDDLLGEVLEMFDKYNMWEDTMLIVNTDHGFLIGDHNWIGKNVMPLYNEVVHIPFYLHVPGYSNNVCLELAQTIDIPATLLDYFDIRSFDNMEGKSLLNVLENDRKNHDNILFGTNGGQTCIYDGRYVYMRSSSNPSNGPRFNYTLMPMKTKSFISINELINMELISGNKFSNYVPILKIELDNVKDTYRFGNLLYDLKNDPQQKNPINNERLETEIIKKLVARMKEIEAPEEEFERLGLTEFS